MSYGENLIIRPQPHFYSLPRDDFITELRRLTKSLRYQARGLRTRHHKRFQIHIIDDNLNPCTYATATAIQVWRTK